MIIWWVSLKKFRKNLTKNFHFQVYADHNDDLALREEPKRFIVKSAATESASSHSLSGQTTNTWDAFFCDNADSSSESLLKNLVSHSSAKRALLRSIHPEESKLKIDASSSIQCLPGSVMESSQTSSPDYMTNTKETKSSNLHSSVDLTNTKQLKPNYARSSFSSPNKFMKTDNANLSNMKVTNRDISSCSGIINSNSTSSSSSFVDLTTPDDGEGAIMVTDSWFSSFDPQTSTNDGSNDDIATFPHASEVGIHQETGDSTYQCRVCSYRSHKRWDFVNHVRIHTGEKPFVCPHCPHRSALKNNLRRHIMLKHGPSSYRQQ
ncbi:Zinc finger C2H2-type [Trinorchestia longiramus]|nr:Zinc finger C2H2-type [Trinorchestia longiramus]